jgi:uncharacterized protein YndB with AHSA1/START domain
MGDATTVEQTSAHEVSFNRLLDAPPELVWETWSDPKHLHEWWGPDGFTTTTYEFEFVPGGVWRLTMHGPDGTDYPTRIVFREIVPPSRLMYENGWDLPGAPLDFKVIASFAAEGTKTRLSFRMIFRDAAALKSAVEQYGVMEGGKQTFDRLATYLSDI